MLCLRTACIAKKGTHLGAFFGFEVCALRSIDVILFSLVGRTLHLAMPSTLPSQDFEVMKMAFL